MRDLLSTGVALWVTVFSIPVLATTFVGKSIISLPVDGSTYTVNDTAKYFHDIFCRQ